MESDMKGIKILVAEDNEVNRKVIKLLLNMWGSQFDFAMDGQEAIHLFSEREYDLILMDCQMPKMSGLEATEHIRNFEISKNRMRTPIVAMTANAMKGDREKCLAVGMDDFLAKPFKSGEVKEKISIWLSKKRLT